MKILSVKAPFRTPLTDYQAVKAPRVSMAGQQLGWIIIAAFAYMGFALDWHYISTGNTVGVWMFGTKPVLAMSVLVLLFFFDRHVRFGLSQAPLNYSEKGVLRRYAVLFYAFFIVVLLERMVESPHDQPLDTWSYWALFEMPLWALLGYAYVNRREKAEWLFERLATIIAVGSVISFALRIVLGTEEIQRFFGPAGWPMRFFFLFGFCWFFVKYFADSRDKKNALGLLACSLETLAALHKPFILACTLAIPFMLFLIAKQQRRAVHVSRRVIVAVTIAVCGIFLVDFMTHGAVRTFVQHEIYLKYLKTDLSYVIRWDPAEAHIYLSGGRFRLWSVAFERFYDDPLLGSGLGQSLEIGVGLVSMHNGYLDLLLSFGILGCIPVLIGLFQWFRYTVHSALSRGPEAFNSIVFLGYMLAIMAYNAGGTSRVFIPSSCFMFFVFGAALRLAVAASSNSYPEEAATAKKLR